MNGFFGFREMISVTLIQLLYALGALVLTAGPIIVAVLSYRDEQIVRYCVVTLVGGNIIWRLFCEGLIVIFRIHETLESIDRKLRVRFDLDE